MAAVHYAEHEGKPFFEDLVVFITRSPVVVMVVEGPDDTYKVVRTLMGATNPVEAAPGTIRGDLAIETGENLVHGSDCPGVGGAGDRPVLPRPGLTPRARLPWRPGPGPGHPLTRGLRCTPERHSPGRPCAHPPIPVA